MIATIRFILDTTGNYAEKKVWFPDVPIVRLGELIEAYCQGYRAGSGHNAHVVALSSNGRRDAAFDSNSDNHAIAGHFFNLRVGSVNREKGWGESPYIERGWTKDVKTSKYEPWIAWKAPFDQPVYAIRFAGGWTWNIEHGWRHEGS